MKLFGKSISGVLTNDIISILPLVKNKPPARILSIPDIDHDRVRGVFVGFMEDGKPFFWNPLLYPNPHLVVLGTSGSGKTSTIRTLIVRSKLFCKPPPNTLIIDSVGEYNNWVDVSGGVVYRIGEKHSINIIDAPATTPEHKIAQAIAIATHSGIIDRRAPRQQAVFRKALVRAFQERGIDLTTDISSLKSSDIPTLRDVYNILEEMEEAKDVRSEERRIIASVKERIYNVISGSPAFNRPSTIDIISLFKGGLVCVDLHTLPTEAGKTAITLLILWNLIYYMRQSGESRDKIRLFIVLDEAHRVYRSVQREEESALGVGHPLDIIAREGRKYGVSLIMSSQLVEDFGKQILGNVATIFILKVALSQVKALQTRLGLPIDICQEVVNQPTFHSHVILSIKDFPQTPPIKVRVNPYFVKEDISVEIPAITNVASTILASIRRVR